MTTRMLHPEHGATHAYGTSDIERHQALGWVVEEEAKPAPVPTPAPSPVPAQPVPAKRAYHFKAK